MKARSLHLALGFAAALLGLAVPVLPLLWRRAFHVAALFGAVWLILLIVFFCYFAGVGFLGHLALWALACAAMLAPVFLAAQEAILLRLRKRLCGYIRPAR